MNKVKISYYGLIRNVIGNLENESYLSEDGTVGELLRSLVEKYGDSFRSTMLTPDWHLLPITMIHINGHDINEINGLNTKLEDNSELSITVLAYATSGG